MERIRALIVDDEPLAREVIRLLVKDDSQIEIIGEAANGFEAIPLIETKRPDLLFLDIQMPEIDGFEVLAQIEPSLMPTVVFITAYDSYAIKAFEAQALDYLLKPFNDERFYKALARVKCQLEQHRSQAENAKLKTLLGQVQPNRSDYLDRLIIKSAGRVFFLKVAEIDWIEAADYYALLHVGRKTHLLRESLTELETKLDPEKFIRIHRSAVVNIERISELRNESSGECQIIMADQTALKLSRRRRAKAQALLNRRIS